MDHHHNRWAGVTGASSVVDHVARLIGETGDARAIAAAGCLDERFIHTGRLGVASGQGVYSYPDSACSRPGFP
jgi:3-hydroxyacyl-CoA dehydrogenase